MKSFDKLCQVLNEIASAVTVAVMVFLTILIGVSVFSRFVFNSPIAWQYETTLVGFSWIIFIGNSITFHNDEHMRLTFVPNAMKPKTRKIWLCLMDVCCFLFLAWAAVLSVGVVKNAMQTLYQTIPVPRGIFYMPFPIGCVLSLFQIINVNYKRLTGPDEAVMTETELEKLAEQGRESA